MIRYQDPLRAIVGSTIYPGASVYVLLDGDALANIYADPTLETPLPNPLTADAAGYLPAIYIHGFVGDVTCRVVSDGVEVFDLTATFGCPLSVSVADPKSQSGASLPLATRTFYEANTTVLATIYTDADSGVEATNPQTANAVGEFSPAYIDASSAYRVVLKDGSGRLIYDLNSLVSVAPVLTASQSEPGASIDVSWTAAIHPSGVIDNYNVYVSVNGSDFSLLETVDGTTLSIVDATHYLDGDELIYHVIAISGDDQIQSNDDDLTYQALLILSNEVLFPWNTDPVADPRNAQGAYIYYTGSVSPVGGETGGVSGCGDVGLSVSGGGPYTSLGDAVTALNAEWEAEYAGNRAYSAVPIAYSSSRNTTSGTVNDAANAASHPGAVTSIYRRYNWLHLAVEGKQPGYIGSIDAQAAEGYANDTGGYVAAHGNGGYVFIVGSGGGSWTGLGLTALCWKAGASTADGFYQAAESAFGGRTCGAGNGAAAYACAIVRTEIQPAKPTDNAVIVSGTFKVLQQFLAASGTAQASNPQKLPLNPCLRNDDPDYSNQTYWEAEYDAAVTAGTMASGKTYGTDYPVVQSWAYQYQVWL